MSVFPPIAEYGFLSDCEVNALVAPDGSVEWLCLPRPGLAERVRRAARSPRRVLPVRRRERIRARHSVAICPGHDRARDDVAHADRLVTVQDLLVVGPRRATNAATATPAPGDTSRTGTLLRLATCSSGRVEVEMNCLPAVRVRHCERGVDATTEAATGTRRCVTATSRCSWRAACTSVRRRAQLRAHDARRGGVGVRRTVVGRARARRRDGDAFAQLRDTEQYWRNWLSTGEVPRSPRSGRTSSAARSR